ncbi:thiol-disulfide oxidoreductase DCC family protein [Acinetobacter sp. YQ_14]|uniref:thiol-disulfide oxidoreductase DCC family protein n=1 Tax=Acinetobacter sp. YQ_14 TaxID=3367236 RepID=UPI00370AC7E3
MPNQIQQLIQEHNMILFDAQCVLCSTWADFMIKHNHQTQFKLVSVQSQLGQQILRKYQFPTDHFETMILLEKGQLYTESTAFLRIMQRLDFPYSILKYGKLLPKKLRDFAYRRIALNRYRLFGKTEHCYVVGSDVESHFLLDEKLK